MFGDRKGRAVKIQNGMAVFTAVLVRRGRKLSVVGVFVAIRAGGEFHFVNRVFSGGEVALVAFPFLRAVLELAVVNILMAIRTVGKLERTLEVPACMASNATHFDVGAEQGVFCLG